MLLLVTLLVGGAVRVACAEEQRTVAGTITLRGAHLKAWESDAVQAAFKDELCARMGAPANDCDLKLYVTGIGPDVCSSTSIPQCASVGGCRNYQNGADRCRAGTVLCRDSQHGHCYTSNSGCGRCDCNPSWKMCRVGYLNASKSVPLMRASYVLTVSDSTAEGADEKAKQATKDFRNFGTSAIKSKCKTCDAADFEDVTLSFSKQTRAGGYAEGCNCWGNTPCQHKSGTDNVCYGKQEHGQSKEHSRRRLGGDGHSNRFDCPAGTTDCGINNEDEKESEEAQERAFAFYAENTAGYAAPGVGASLESSYSYGFLVGQLVGALLAALGLWLFRLGGVEYASGTLLAFKAKTATPGGEKEAVVLVLGAVLVVVLILHAMAVGLWIGVFFGGLLALGSYSLVRTLQVHASAQAYASVLGSGDTGGEEAEGGDTGDEGDTRSPKDSAALMGGSSASVEVLEL